MQSRESLRRILTVVIAACLTGAVVACGPTSADSPLQASSERPASSPASKRVWVSVQGLDGESLALSLDGRDALHLQSEGRHAFSERVAVGERYSVSIDTLPASHDCELENATGTVSDDDVEVRVRCGVNDTTLAFLEVHSRDARLEPELSPDVDRYGLDAYSVEDTAWLEVATSHPKASLQLRYEKKEIDAAPGALPLALGVQPSQLEIEVKAPWGSPRIIHVELRKRAELTLRTTLPSTAHFGEFANFGSALAVSTNELAVGSPQAPHSDGDTHAYQVGRVDVYRRTSDGWTPDESLRPSSPTSDDYLAHAAEFGTALAFAGKQLLVGAPMYTDAPTDKGEPRVGAGAVFVYERDADGWIEVERIRPESQADGDRFGVALASAGTVLAVGNPRYGGPGTVEILRKQPSGRWRFEQALHGEVADDAFGQSLALDGQHLVVGAPNERLNAKEVGEAPPSDSDEGGQQFGSVQTFTTMNGTWTREQKLIRKEAGSFGGFGNYVDVLDDTLVIGAPGDDPAGSANVKVGAGAAYVYRRHLERGWDLTEALYGAEELSGDIGPARFGVGVTLTHEALWLAAPSGPGVHAQAPDFSGSVLRYARLPNGEMESTELALPLVPSQAYAGFGAALALGPDGTLAVTELSGGLSGGADNDMVHLFH